MSDASVITAKSATSLDIPARLGQLLRYLRMQVDRRRDRLRP
jgi:hypothetical protein